MNARQIIHLWANGTDKCPRSSNVTASCGTLYSYAMKIAQRDIEIKGGKPSTIVLVTCESSTVTTNKHITWAMRAINPTSVVYRVPIVDVGSFDFATRIGHHKENHKYLVKRIADIAGGITMRMREETKLDILARAEQARLIANQYAIDFGIRTKPIATPLAAVEQLAAAKKRADRKEKLRLKRLAAKRQEDYIAWKEGKNNQTFDDMPIVFRLSADGLQVETSKGAEFPIRHAKRIAPALMELREKGIYGDVSRDNWQLGHYGIDRVTPSGVIDGCHNVSWEAIEELAKQLELFELVK